MEVSCPGTEFKQRFKLSMVLHLFRVVVLGLLVEAVAVIPDTAACLLAPNGTLGQLAEGGYGGAAFAAHLVLEPRLEHRIKMRGRQTRRVGVRFQAGVRKLQNNAFLPAVGFGIPAYLLGRYVSYSGRKCRTSLSCR